ncbi:uridine kinase [Hellea balneolensis]|uniref:uridine kinase n=1 Tax=Hellea balneolensis TaxID=287478 RepID=UPI0004217AC3|nr:uridine kinase [Hellea balneolensis]
MSIIIAIAGGSCSGKTTLARHLQHRLGAAEAMLIRQDDYYHDIRDRGAKKNGGDEMPNFDVPEALDFGLLAENLEALKNGDAVQLPNYDFTTHQRIRATEPLDAKTYTIVEGLLLLNDPFIREQADVSIYMRCPYETRFERRLARDVAERGRTEDFVHHQFAQDVEPAHQKYIQPSAVHANLLIEQDDYVSSIDAVLERIIEALPNIDAPQLTLAL